MDKEIEFLVKKPFYVFKISNFLDKKLYFDLYNNFPTFDKFTFEKGLNGKFMLDCKSESYKNLLKKNSAMQEFHNFIYGKTFFDFFTKKLYFNFLWSHKDNIIRLIKYMRPLEQNNNTRKITDLFFSKIKININYSNILNEGSIDPHTDSLRKLLSLMIYFPDSNNNKNLDPDERYREKELTYGTQFWTSSIKSYNNKHIDDREYFKSNAEKIYRTPFVANDLFGFIRNNQSWHSVDSVKVKPNYVRKSININLFYEN